jgi:hypothetical protein
MVELTLVHASAQGPFVNLIYRWSGSLSETEADKLDTRARAYIACAIYDAATTAGLACEPGPPHGQRPSWLIMGTRIPTALVNAGFDVSDSTCFMQVGPGIMMMGQRGEASHSQKLISGFQAQFRKIRI